MTYEIVVVNADAWVGIYLNGRLIRQDHTIEPDDAFAALEKHIPDLPFTIESIWADETWLFKEMKLPQLLIDVVRE